MSDGHSLDAIRSHPMHVHVLTASRGVARIICLDDKWEFSGTYEAVVEAWRDHTCPERETRGLDA